MARRQSSLATLRLLLTSGVDVMSQMPVTSEHLHRVIPSFSLSMIRVDRKCAPNQHYSEYFDDFSHHLFATSGHLFSANTDDPAAFSRLLTNPDPVGALVETRPEYLAGATHQHLFKRNGIHHCLDLALRDGGGPLGILGIFREEDGRRFSAEDVTTARALYPWLVHAFARQPDGGPFDEQSTAMLVATREGKIVWASEAARRWLEDASGGPERTLIRQADELPEACRRVCQTLERARTSGASDGVPTESLAVPGGRLRLRAYAMDTPGADERRVGIHLTLEMSHPLRVLTALGNAGLPPQLQRFAYRLWQRTAPADISRELDISHQTMKSYRKELYTRLGVSSAEELHALLEAQANAITFDLRPHRPRAAKI